MFFPHPRSPRLFFGSLTAFLRINRLEFGLVSNAVILLIRGIIWYPKRIVAIVIIFDTKYERRSSDEIGFVLYLVCHTRCRYIIIITHSELVD